MSFHPNNKDVKNVYPLTQSQLWIWAGQQLHPDTPLYNVPFTFEIPEKLDIDLFSQAFQELINHTDALRLYFMEEDGEPRQKVRPSINFSLPLIDLSDAPNPEEQINAWLEERSQQMFDLSDILFDAALIKQEESHYIWYINQHHLTTDAWAVTVLFKELVKIYKALIEGSSSEFIFPSFFDYVTFERTRHQKLNTRLKDYWTTTLEKTGGRLTPYGFKKWNSTTLSKRMDLALDPGKSSQLRQLIQEADLKSWSEHLSLFSTFLTVYATLLYRISGQKKITVGTPSNNRTTQKFKQTAGVFIEFFPITIEITAEDSFGSLYQKVLNKALEFLKFGTPGASTHKMLKAYQAVFNYIHAEVGDFDGKPVNSQWLHPNHSDPSHLIRLHVYDFNGTGNFTLGFDINQSVFENLNIDQIPQHFIKLLDAFLKDRSQNIGKPGLLGKAEQAELIDNFNQTIKNQSVELTPIQQFEEQALQTPEKPALETESQTFNYKVLNEQANQLAYFLIEKGVKAGERAAIHAHRSPDLIVGILACMKAGVAYLPISWATPRQRMEYMLTNAKVSMLLSENPDHYDVEIDAQVFSFDAFKNNQAAYSAENIGIAGKGDSEVYILYTSGSTGHPKGVRISNSSLSNYLNWALEEYGKGQPINMPLFTAVGFDLTVTSLFLPLLSGGRVVIYPEPDHGPDLTVLKAVEENKVNTIKLTPSHLRLLSEEHLRASDIKTWILGGEAFNVELAQKLIQSGKKELAIYNEYGPTEATVGCVVHRFNPQKDIDLVPVGRPIDNMRAYVLDTHLNPVPKGVVGELYLAGKGLAMSYIDQGSAENERFMGLPHLGEKYVYRTGDLVRFNERGIMEYLGRDDRVINLGGKRLDLGELESILKSYDDIEECFVHVSHPEGKAEDEAVEFCRTCGIPSNYPGVTFDETNLCNLCASFEHYQEHAKAYFKPLTELEKVFEKGLTNPERKYDCIMLLSGGKDSSYALARLKEMGLNILAFTLDNGYISEEAKQNINRVVKALGVDHVYGETEAMDDIFVDSLERFSNVCNGCFKTIYTLSTRLAYEKNIPYIVTGLSRGQFFETRLSEELFWNENTDFENIDQIILDARKAYHRTDDAVNQLLDVSIFETDEVFEKVKYLDFYRFCDVSLEEMYDYLNNKLPWIRPSDTGRSTNCLINEAGIFIHKKERGFHNYAYPYSWDVRIGHKTREETLEEINEVIQEENVRRILQEIGYQENSGEVQEQLVAFYQSTTAISEAELRNRLEKKIAPDLIPRIFLRINSIPITENGKIDKKALEHLLESKPQQSRAIVAPRNEIEELLHDLWCKVLQEDQVSVFDNFIELGGQSLTAIRLVSRIKEAIELEIPVTAIFEKPTIAELAEYIEGIILEKLSD